MKNSAPLAWVLLGAASASAQQPLPAGVVQNYSLEAGSFLDALLKVSAQFRFPLGVEWVKSADTLKPVRFSREATTVSDIIQSVASMPPGYDWRVENGVVHVFQTKLVNDSRNPLNIMIDSFDQWPETVSWANNNLFQRVSRVVRHPELSGIGGSVLGYPGEPRFLFAAKNIAARSCLDKIVSAGLPIPLPGMKRIWVATFPERQTFSRTGFLEVSLVENPKFVSEDGQPFWVLLTWGGPPRDAMVR